MKANIICDICGISMGSLEKPVINDYDIESNKGCFTCSCGGAASLVIQPEE
jgi:hypothetical protein